MVTGEEFDFDETRRRFPSHWDDDGWPAHKSTWRSRNYPHMRVKVLEAVRASAAVPGSIRYDQIQRGELEDGDVRTMISWDGDLEGLRGMFAYENTDRWNIDKNGFVYGSAGIDQRGRWRDEGPILEVIFERELFGGPDTWHLNFEDRTPFFEPIADDE